MVPVNPISNLNCVLGGVCNHGTASLATDLVAEMLPFQPETCREC